MKFDTLFTQVADKTLGADNASALVALQSESSQESVAAALDSVFANNSATFAQLLTVTKAEPSWFTKGNKELADQIFKISTRNVTLNADYERSVKRSIEKLGGNAGDYNKSGTYTIKDPAYDLTALLCHAKDNARKYLRCHINNSKTLTFNVSTGKFLSSEEALALPLTKAGVTSFSKAPKIVEKVSDGVEHTVEPKNFKLEGVIAIKTKGETIAL